MKSSLRSSSDDFCCFRPLVDGSRRMVYEITRKCNLRCVHCMAPLDLAEGLSHERKTALMHELVSNNISKIMFTGGEPLLDSNLVDYVSIAANNGIIVDINSNLTLLTEDKIKQLVNAGLGEVTTSIDGNKETHCAIRGSADCYDKTVNAMNIFIKLGVKVDVVCMAMDLTRTALGDVAKLVQNVGGASITYSGVILKGRAQKHHIVSDNDYIKDEIEKIRAYAHIPVRTVRLFSDDYSRCHKGEDMIGVDYIGNVHPCLQDRCNRMINLKNNTLENTIRLMMTCLDSGSCCDN